MSDKIEYPIEVERLCLHLAPQALKEAQAFGEELVDAVLVDGKHDEEELVVLVLEFAASGERRLGGCVVGSRNSSLRRIDVYSLRLLGVDVKHDAYVVDHVRAGFDEWKGVVAAFRHILGEELPNDLTKTENT